MGRKLKTDVPVPKSVLIPQWPFIYSFREKERQRVQESSLKDLRSTTQIKASRFTTPGFTSMD